MATATYTLGVNDDGSQNTGFPAGDKGFALVTPDSLTAVELVQPVSEQPGPSITLPLALVQISLSQSINWRALS